MSPARILYVEDDMLLRELTTELLGHPDRAIVACADGDTAWTKWQERPFDIVLTDVSLPGGLSGQDLALRLLALRPDLAVVLCTGHALPHDLSHLGPNVHSLQKPFDFEALEQLLDRLASR